MQKVILAYSGRRPGRLGLRGNRSDAPLGGAEWLDDTRCMKGTLTGITICYVMHDSKFFRTHRREIARDLLAAGCQLHLIAPNAKDAIGENGGVVAHDWKLNRWSMNPCRELLSLLHLCRLYRRIGPTIVHHFSVKSIVYGLIASMVCRIPLAVCSITGKGHVFTASGAVARARRKLLILCYRCLMRRRGVALIFQTQKDYGDFLRWQIVSPDHAVVIPGSGVDTTRYHPHPARAPDKMVLFASRLLKEKGVLDFIAAIQLLKNRVEQLRAVVAGPFVPGHPDAVTEGELRDRCVEAGVEYAGELEDLSSLMGQATVFCFPSRYGEGVPRVVLEAVASGSAVISYPCDGLREVFRDSIFECAPDPQSLAGAIERLLNDDALLQRHVHAAHRTILEQGLDTGTIADRTMRFYRTQFQAEISDRGR
ncbi:MAG: glycosyltransferase [Bdellovibrionota bacterium]|nr:MAG: glycosyltransferase [Bdellovibrionota bacterium]